MSSDSKTFNVTSFNQIGGITAGQVVVGQGARHLDDRLRQQLRDGLPRARKVTVVAVMGDGEAFQFADEVKRFLESDGYTVSGIDQVVYSGPVVGQQIHPREAGSEVVIGTRSST